MKLWRKTLLPINELLITIASVLGVISTCLIVVYVLKRREHREEKRPERETNREFKGLPFKIVKSVSPREATHAKDELRILDLEREILSDAIRRLYEAHAEGKITEDERERLARVYKSRMVIVKEAISKDESLVALHELEAMQEDLMKLFSDRFDEISTKVEELRSKVEPEPIREVTIHHPEVLPMTGKRRTAIKAKKERKRKKPPIRPSPKMEAEKKLEKIRAEVEKVLDRLGQMEIET